MTADNAILKPHVILMEGQIWTTSIVVAQHFGKRHDNVIQSIVQTLADLPPEFAHLNFQESSYVNLQNKSQPMYRMTRDGFSLIAMGFTGKKALAWKVAYIKTFSAMEQTLLRRASAAAVSSISKPQLDSAEFFLTLFYALNQERSAAALMWYLLKQDAHIRPYRGTLREISAALDFTTSHTGVNKSAKHLEGLGLIETQPGRFYKVLFDALVQYIGSRRTEGDSHPGLGDFVTPDAKLLH